MYWLGVVGVIYLIIRSSGTNPFTTIIFWLAASFFLLSEAIYLVFYFRNPKGFEIADPMFLVHLRGKEIRTIKCDLSEVFFQESRLFTGAHIIQCSGKSFYVFYALSNYNEFIRLLQFYCNDRAA